MVIDKVREVSSTQTYSNPFESMKAAMVLNKTSVKVTMKGISVQTCINQYFENNENKSIEAVYTFPLPLDAILLDILVKLDDKTVRGSIQPKVEAMDRYEKAIEKGDTGILLEKVDDGLFTLNIGNLLPGQKAKVTFVYSEVLNWQGTDLRYVLPTVIAPKYGYCPLEAQQQPEYDYRVEYPLDFSLNIKGDLSQAKISSPSHLIEISSYQKKKYQGKKISLLKSAFLDRDFILNIQQSNQLTPYKATAVAQKDKLENKQQYAIIASFTPVFNQEINSPHPKKRTGRVVNILVDCSGSMQGDSIHLAKKSLLLALDELSEQDLFSVTRFGNQVDSYTQEIIPATKHNIVNLKRKIRHMQADLGGTEIFKALDYVSSQQNNSGKEQDCFLITDGEVWGDTELQDTILSLQKRHQRVFTVGVGSAVSEKLVKQLALETNGSCEFVAPNENMTNKIHRHFKRLFMPSLNQVSLNCGTDIIWQSTPDNLFVGDSLTIFAKLQGKPSKNISLSAYLNEQLVFKQKATIEFDKNPQLRIPRQVASHYLHSLTDNNRADIAVNYQLMDETTAFIMVEENHSEESVGLPEFRKVPQMMAAGWAGQGIVEESTDSDILYCMSTSFIEEPEQTLPSRRIASSNIVNEDSTDMTYLDIPSFLRRQNDSDDESINKLIGDPLSLTQFMTNFRLAVKNNKIELDKLSSQQFLDLKLPASTLNSLVSLVIKASVPEHHVLLHFVYLLAKHNDKVTSEFTQLLLEALEHFPVDNELTDLITNWGKNNHVWSK